MESVPLERLTTIHGAFEAHVLAARLEYEGLDVELRGATSAAYGLTVGDMARVDVFVPCDQVEDGRLVLLTNEVEDVFDDRPRMRHATAGRLIAGAVVVSALASLARITIV